MNDNKPDLTKCTYFPRNVWHNIEMILGIYLSKYQKPTEIVPGLRSKTIWSLTDLDPDTVKMIEKLKDKWPTILAEGTELKEKESRWMEDKRLLESGSWDQLSFIGNKRRILF
jgi:hypothetical protein